MSCLVIPDRRFSFSFATLRALVVPAKKNGRNCVYYGTMLKNGKAKLRYIRFKDEPAKKKENKAADGQAV